MSKVEALKELLTKMADDQLILGHRNSEWIGIGPVLEEDIAFGSQAQDKTGHALNLYKLIEQMGGVEPDKMAFRRQLNEYKCCHLVELSVKDDYALTLARHFYFDNSEVIRFKALGACAYPDLAGLANKFYSELKYHVFHANTWVKNLLNGSEESRARMISALNEYLPYALGIFEEGPYEELLINEGLFIGEKALHEQWESTITNFLEQFDVKLDFNVEAHLGGRGGVHTDELQPLLNEMCEVINLEDENMAW